MNLIKKAIAGTLESSDIMVTVEPASTLKINLKSSVEKQFSTSIKNTVLNVAKKMNITGANIILVDHGALDCTIRARLETAFLRATKEGQA